MSTTETNTAEFGQTDLTLVKVPHVDTPHLSIGLASKRLGSKVTIGTKLPSGATAPFVTARAHDLYICFDLVADTVAVTTPTQTVVYPIDHEKTIGSEMEVGESYTIFFQSRDRNEYIVNTGALEEFVIHGGAQFMDLPKLEAHTLVIQAEEFKQDAIEAQRYAELDRPPKNAHVIEIPLDMENLNEEEAMRLLRLTLPEEVYVPEASGTINQGLRWGPQTNPTTISELVTEGSRFMLAREESGRLLLLLPGYRGGLGVQWIDPHTGRADGVVLHKDSMRQPIGLGSKIEGSVLCALNGAPYKATA